MSVSEQRARLDKLFDEEKNLIFSGGVHRVCQASPQYAEFLLSTGNEQDRMRAINIITAILDLQHTEEGQDLGRFPMLLPEEWVDLNGVLFLLPQLVMIMETHKDTLPSDLYTRMEKSLRLSAAAVQRRWDTEVFDIHRDFTCYSNIFVLYVHALFLLARVLDDQRLAGVAAGQWKRWFNHTSYFGIDEFVSHYNNVVCRGLRGIISDAAADSVKQEAEAVYAHILSLQYGLHHPLLGIPLSGMSRSYRRFTVPGEGMFPLLEKQEEDVRADIAAEQEYRNREFPYQASGRAGTVPFSFKTWQTEAAGMGSMTGGHYFAQQIHLIAAAGRSPEDRFIVFMNADANPVNGWVAQHENRALCLFARTNNSYFHAQRGKHFTELPSDEAGRPPSVGFTGNGDAVQKDDGALIFSGFGHTVRVNTFSLKNGNAVPSVWTKDTAEFKEETAPAFRAPVDSVFVVCTVELSAGTSGEAVHEAVCVSQNEDRISVSCGEELSLELKKLPCGEWRQILPAGYDIQPLFLSPAHTLYPGDLSRDAAAEV